MIVGLFRFLIVFIIVYSILVLFSRFIFPFLFNKNYREKKSGFYYSGDKYSQSNKNEGEVTINKTSKKNKKIDNNVGEYIDYEEIKD